MKVNEGTIQPQKSRRGLWIVLRELVWVHGPRPVLEVWSRCGQRCKGVRSSWLA